MAGEPTNGRSGWGRGFLLAGLFLLPGLVLLGAWRAFWFSPVGPDPPTSTVSEPPDPRRSYAGPYRNIHPDVQYVGDAKCVGCHEDIANSYAGHPMGRSLRPAAELLDRQRDTPETNNPFTALGRRFTVDRQGKRVWHRQTALEEALPAIQLAQEVQWVIGSGKKGYSYLAERDGYLLQTPISWFTQKQRWDLSPGYGPSALAGRVVPAACLFCHTNRVQEHPEHPDRFVAPVFQGHAIGCERCHGPGELHAAGDFDHTIVNPARLSPPLREAVCEQCHLEGEARILRSGRGLFDYRPGLPLNDFWAVLVQGRHSGEDAKAVNHVEQMYQSKCFQRPVGDLKLGCTTCHDPHVHLGPAKRETHYRAACLKCHNPSQGQADCSLPLPQRQQTNPPDSCIACHMPRYTSSDIAHTASTDHRIVRRPMHRPVQEIDLARVSFVDFYQGRFAPPGDPQAERNLGMGLVKMMTAGMLPPEKHGEQALFLLESALGQHPQDADLRESKALALVLLRRPGEARAEARAALARRPGNWRLLAHAGSAALAEEQTEQALALWRQAVEINPFVTDPQINLISLLIRTGHIEEAQTRCRKLLQLDPFHVAGRQIWVGFLLQQGKKAEAQSEFAIIRRLKPPDLAKREEWLQQQMKP